VPLVGDTVTLLCCESVSVSTLVSDPCVAASYLIPVSYAVYQVILKEV